MNHPLKQFKYCPQCGSTHFYVHDEKSKQCGDCGFTYYFNPCAATVAVILNEQGELLVTRRAKEPAKGTLDLPGGFVDSYETVEQGMLREILEETGKKASIVRFLFSVPNIYMYSGFPVHTADCFFLCRFTSNDTMHAMDDVAELMWLPLAALQPSDFGLLSIRQAITQIRAMGDQKEL
ncbi:MAG: NUDIX domain-containing protein [Bacteroidaceae bacterium]